MAIPARRRNGLDKVSGQPGVTKQSQVAARQASGGLDRAIRAIALANVRIEEARFGVTRLDDAVGRARDLNEESKTLHSRLRETVTALARLHRRSGMRPDQVVVLLKDIVASNVLDLSLEQSIERRVVEWGIDAYFAA